MVKEAVNPFFDESEDRASLDSVGIYFRELSRYPRELNQVQEISLFSLIENGSTIKDLRKSALFSVVSLPAVTKQHLNALEDSQSIQQFIALCNLGLVVDLASKYTSGFRQSELFLELIQTGNEALFRAVGNYDPHREGGAQFSTYATECVRAKLIQFMEENRYGVRVPWQAKANIKKARVILNNHQKENAEALSKSELEAALAAGGLPESAIKAALDVIELGLDTPIGPYPSIHVDDGEAVEFPVVDKSVNVEEEVLDRVSVSNILEIASQILNPTQFAALTLSQEHISQPEIAKRLGITRQGVSYALKSAYGLLLKSNISEYFAA